MTSQPAPQQATDRSVSIKIDSTANVEKKVDASKKYDSEGMCVED